MDYNKYFRPIEIVHNRLQWQLNLQQQATLYFPELQYSNHLQYVFSVMVNAVKLHLRYIVST